MTDDSPPHPPVDRPVPPPVTGGGSPETTDPWLGVTLADRYIIESKLGSGGMGVVYRACQVSVNRAVAIKVLPASLGEDWELVRRFMREAKLASTLSHPNTVTLHDFGQIPTGALFLVMELVEGETLESHLSRVGRLPMARAIAIAVQVLDALEEAHGRGIIHRDLKPGNIILSPRAGRPDFIKLLDFGLARGADEGTGNTTRSGAILGTPAYMSPEQGRGQECDPRSDLYSLGILLFELLTGVRPFGGTTNLAILLKHFQEPVPRLSERCPALGVNEALEAALACALAKQRDDRFASAALMRTALIAAVRGTLNSSPSGTPASIPRAPSLAKDPAVAVAVADTLPEIRESGAPASTPRSPAAGESPGVVISGSAPGAAATSGSARGAAVTSGSAPGASGSARGAAVTSGSAPAAAATSGTAPGASGSARGAAVTSGSAPAAAATSGSARAAAAASGTAPVAAATSGSVRIRWAVSAVVVLATVVWVGVGLLERRPQAPSVSMQGVTERQVPGEPGVQASVVSTAPTASVPVVPPPGASNAAATLGAPSVPPPGASNAAATLGAPSAPPSGASAASAPPSGASAAAATLGAPSAPPSGARPRPRPRSDARPAPTAAVPIPGEVDELR